LIPAEWEAAPRETFRKENAKPRLILRAERQRNVR